MAQLREFMLLFRYEPSNTQPTAQEIETMHMHWQTFIGDIAKAGKLVSTHQLGFEGRKIFADHSSQEGIYLADRQTLGGNMIVEATSLDEAATLAQNAPILLMGGMVEIRSVNPM